jgi:hypothetical protein
MASKRHRIKLLILTDKQLLKKTKCNSCENEVPYKELYFYVDESNIAITNNSKGICENCKTYGKENGI